MPYEESMAIVILRMQVVEVHRRDGLWICAMFRRLRSTAGNEVRTGVVSIWRSLTVRSVSTDSETESAGPAPLVAFNISYLAYSPHNVSPISSSPQWRVLLQRLPLVGHPPPRPRPPLPQSSGQKQGLHSPSSTLCHSIIIGTF